MSEAASQNALSAVLALMSGHAIVRSLTEITDLGVPDLLAAGPLSAEQLAAHCQVDAEFLFRLLRALAALGVFVEHPGAPPRFGLSPLSEWLRADHPRSLRDFVRIRGHGMYWQAWGALGEALKTGATAFERAHGASHFEHLERHPEAARLFHDGMRSLSGQIYADVVEAYDFSPFRSIIDVGGGQGVLLAAILKAYPALRGVLFDTASAVEQSDAVLREAGVSGRCEAIAGDFFVSLPKGPDAAILSRIIHNWGDEQALAILRNCRAALPDNGRLLIIEYVVTDGPDGIPAKLFDLQMLVYFGRARERSEAELRQLLGQAGFTLTRIIPTSTGISVIEATVAA